MSTTPHLDIKAGEQARLWGVPGVDGVELMRARFVTQTFSRHFHDCYALGVIEQGALRFSYLGEGHVAPAGTVNLVVPGEVHDGHAADETGWAYRMCYIAPDWVLRAGEEIGWKSESLPFFRAGVLQDPLLAARVRALHQAMEDPGASILERQTMLYAALALWVARHAEDRPGWPNTGKEPVAVAKARDYLRDHVDQDPTLDDLSRETGLSPFHLARTFTASLGIPPHAFLIQERVERARGLIRSGTGLAEAASGAGFADQSHMNRWFKRQVGVTPGAYQRAYQKAYRKSVQDC